MKNLFKIFFLSLCILFLSVPVIDSTKITDPLKADEPYQIQPTSIDDLTYLLFVKGPRRLYAPTFEFEAGNSLKIIGASHEYSELTGIWQEVDFTTFSFFQAQVEESETVTTTTTAPVTTNLMMDRFETTEKTKFLINLYGISFASLPPPFDSVGMLLGAGAYLGANVVFIGFTSTPGEEPEFGSVNPREGEQGQTLDVIVTGINTTFESASTIIIDFGEGINVGSPGVKNDTELNVEISIDDEAKVGARTVTVTYNGTVISEAAAFTVTEKIE